MAGPEFPWNGGAETGSVCRITIEECGQVRQFPVSIGPHVGLGVESRSLEIHTFCLYISLSPARLKNGVGVLEWILFSPAARLSHVWPYISVANKIGF